MSGQPPHVRVCLRPGCGHRNPPSAAACAACGAPLPPLRPATVGPHTESVLPAEIRGLALGLAIGGAVALYFGFNLLPTPVPGAADEMNQIWLALDSAFNVALKVIGAALLLAAAAALTGKPPAALLALLVQAGGGVVFLVVGVLWLVKWRSLSLMTLVMLILGVMSLASLRHVWKLHLAARSDAAAP